MKRKFKLTEKSHTAMIEARINLRKSQKEIAALIGIRQPMYCKLENGDTPVTAPIAEKLAPILGLTELQLLYPERYKAVA